MQGKLILSAFIAALIGAFWDIVTTFTGLCNIIGLQESNSISGKIGSFFIAVVGSCIVLAFNLGTKKIWLEELPHKWVLMSLWLIAVAFDFYTSLAGNYIYIAPSKLSNMTTIIVVCVFTFIVTSCPALMVLFAPDFSDNE
jgi:hypothetical protein